MKLSATFFPVMTFLAILLVNPLFADRQIQFEDITAIAGVDDPTWTPTSAMVDFDNNGRIDIYVCSKSGPNKLFWNEDGTHFLEVAHRAHVDDSSASMDCAFADINNDRCLDLFITNQGGSTCRMYLNNGNGTYTNITGSSGIDIGYAQSATFSDIERDGDLDLYITHDGSLNWLFRNNGNNTFTDQTYWSGVQGLGQTFSCLFSDINGDLIPDLYITSRGSVRNVMYMGIGNGQFVDTTFWSGVDCGYSAGLSALLFDYDNDADLDLYVSNGGTDPDSLYENLGNGQFLNVTQQANILDFYYGRSATCADLNNDGFQDIIVVNYDGCTMIYENNGNGTFSDVTSSSGILYQNDPRGCSAGDIDNDGDIDIYITNAEGGGSNRLYRNLCDDMNYLKVKLVGTISNAYA